MTEDKKKKLPEVIYVDLDERLEKFLGFRVSTGNLAFDRVIGGGIPAGRLTEIYGDFGSGKSRILCKILAMTQHLGGTAVLIDTERSLERGLAVLTDLDISSLMYPDPDQILTIENVFDVIKSSIELFRKKDPEGILTIGWDSVASTPGLEDLENELGANMAAARRAKVISDGLKQIMATVHSQKICLVFVNQIREKLNVLYGEKVDTIGGKALKFTASLRLHIKIAGKIKDDKTEELKGYKGKLIVERSKVCRPFGIVNFEMMADESIDTYSGLLDYMIRHEEIMSKSGGWYYFKDNPDVPFRKDDFPASYVDHEEGKKKKETHKENQNGGTGREGGD